ncbi:D-glycerate dehydrogenase [Maritimibacter sp. 55A14]|uniref:2-hydroxyacid dehydrogenase n=1 Tax=Maritimibacter sp. 55A14 TaxID=2174844 RepID=UPI000D614560|nr:D-glycerate dehydrogenase [Maritimibacter sp. 55A14]PWE32169.1 D-glycerate dehydrogenase [Maritimibacter sp. 55A14]
MSDTERPRVLVTRRWPDKAEDRLRALFDVTLNEDDTPLGPDAMIAAAQDYDAVLPTVSDRIPPDFYTVPDRRVRLLANYGVGHNHIDTAAAREAGIAVTNTPGVLTDATADLAMGLLLAAARRIGEGERELRSGNWAGWRPTHMIGAQVAGATLGIIGFGRIGKAMAQRGHHGFGMDVVFHNRSKVDDAEAARYGARQLDSVGDVMEAADFVSLHCPGGAETRHIVDAAALARMKPTGYLINTARGDVVDEAALTAALTERRIAGAGLDVYEAEPHVGDELRGLENVVLAPHLGSATATTRLAMGMRAIDNAEAFFAGRDLPNRVV